MNKTWGFEASVGWNDRIGGVQYSARAILSDAKTRVVDYGGQDTYTLGLNYVREGYPVLAEQRSSGARRIGMPG